MIVQKQSIFCNVEHTKQRMLFFVTKKKVMI